MNCSKWPESQFRSLSLIQGLTAVVCLALCILILLLVLCRKAFQSVLQRLFIYLIVSTMCYLAAVGLQGSHYFNYTDPDDKLCEAVGFLNGYTAAVQYMFFFGLTLFLLIRVCTPYLNEHCTQCCTWQQQRLTRLLLETLFIAIPIILPLLYCWVPLVQHKYGLIGPWCWIRNHQRINCSEIDKIGQLEREFFWAIPFSVGILYTLVTFFVMLAVFCQWRTTFRTQRGVVRGVVFLLVLLLLYTTLSLIIMGSRFKGHQKNYNLWIFAAVGIPINATVMPVTLLLYMNAFEFIKLCRVLRRSCGHCCLSQYHVLSVNGATPHPQHSEDCCTIAPRSLASNIPSETIFEPPVTSLPTVDESEENPLIVRAEQTENVHSNYATIDCSTHKTM